MSCVPEQSCSDGASAAGEGGETEMEVRTNNSINTAQYSAHKCMHTYVCLYVGTETVYTDTWG